MTASGDEIVGIGIGEPIDLKFGNVLQQIDEVKVAAQLQGLARKSVDFGWRVASPVTVASSVATSGTGGAVTVSSARAEPVAAKPR